MQALGADPPRSRSRRSYGETRGGSGMSKVDVPGDDRGCIVVDAESRCEVHRVVAPERVPLRKVSCFSGKDDSKVDDAHLGEE